MDSTGIYENLPLRVSSDLSSENLQNGNSNSEVTHPVSPISQTTTVPPPTTKIVTSSSGPDGLSSTKKQINSSLPASKKRKSTSEIPKTSSANFQTFLAKIKPRSSRSSSFEMCDRKKKKGEGADDERKATKNEESEDDLDAGEETQLTSQKIVNQHSTPTAGFDDGYGSCNSSPHGSGKHLYDLILFKKIKYKKKNK